MLIYFILIICMRLCDVFGEQEKTESNTTSFCTTLNNDQYFGVCISIRNCSPLLKILLERGHQDAAATYLRKLQCGMEDTTPKVCCRITTNQTALLPLKKEDSSHCGISHKNRLIGFNSTNQGDWPWMVGLGYRTATNSDLKFHCGGTLISDKWVITAARCVSNTEDFTLTAARMGDINLYDKMDDKVTPVDVPIDEIIPHPEYSSDSVVNDIALLRLRNPVTFSKLVRPICIPHEAKYRGDEFYVRKAPFIFGWGATDWRDPVRNSLYDEQVEIIDNVKCAQNFTNLKSAVIDQRVLCGELTRNSCNVSDTGGPLIAPATLNDVHFYYLVGIASYGTQCEFSYPAVYTRVAQFSDWINRVTGV